MYLFVLMSLVTTCALSSKASTTSRRQDSLCLRTQMRRYQNQEHQHRRCRKSISIPGRAAAAAFANPLIWWGDATKSSRCCAAHSSKWPARYAPRNRIEWAGLRLPPRCRRRSVRRSAAPGMSWALSARRPDSDSERIFNERSRIDPPTPASSPFMTEGDAASRVNGGNSHGARAGRGASNAGQGRRERASSRRAVAATCTTVDSAARTGKGTGVDQNDPLVKAWKSAEVLNPSRDEFPLDGRRRQYPSRQDGGRGRRPVQDTAGRGGGRGRGARGGRGGRGRCRESKPMGMYRGDDKVPWYIREVQDKGLDTEGSFKQWWKDNLDPEAITASIKEMKVDELKAQLETMGLATTGLKAALAQRLAEGLLKFSLSDDNFQHAEVIDNTANDADLPSCFPQVYETLSEDELEELWRLSARKRTARS